MRAALRQSGAAAVLTVLLLAIAPPAADGAPRLSEDGSALVLQEEAGGQPAVVFSMDRQTGRREIRLTGGAQVLPTISLRCPGGQRTIGLTATEPSPVGTTARYRVSDDVAQVALRSPDCRLVLVGSLVPIPHDLLARVWGSPQQAAAPGHVLEGVVVSVVDGDTIRVRIGSRTEAVRYIGVNTPELNHPARGREPGAREATEVNAGLVQGERVRLELDVQERDRYGRLLAYAYVGETMVNAELVRRGFAQVMTVPPNVRHQALFVPLQQEAREHNRGLWARAESSDSAEPPAKTEVRRDPSGRPWRRAGERVDVSREPPDQGQLHDVLRRALHLPRAGRAVLQPDQAGTVLRQWRGGGGGRVPGVEPVERGCRDGTGAVAFLLGAFGCFSASASPPPPTSPRWLGDWSGPITMGPGVLASGGGTTGRLDVTFTQRGRGVSGAFRGPGFKGSYSAVLFGHDLSGTLSFQVLLGAGTVRFDGRVDGDRIDGMLERTPVRASPGARRRPSPDEESPDGSGDRVPGARAGRA